MRKKGWILGTLVIAFGAWALTGCRPRDRVLQVFSPTAAAIAQETSGQGALEFPFAVPDTGLIVQNLAQYEGPFLETEDQEPVAQVAALMIYNPGDRQIASAELVVMQGQRKLSFSVTCLPPRSRVLVLEKNGQLYSPEPIKQCLCLSLAEEMPQAVEIQVTDWENGLEVKNLTSTEKTVILYYKQYISDGGFYLGGVTGQTRVEGLGAGESRNIVAAGYAPGYCHIVKMQIESPRLE